MEKMVSLLKTGFFSLRVILDPAIEGSPYEGASLKRRKKNDTSKPSMPIFRRRLAWR